ncbi:hypothetical protein TorRG33x02_157510 [Trema orientale]|uniref:Uncharacterized protein n=1 Tax=Trema orientale TaxID=63057 RepID=A0A2P5ESD7_TREOI|nr:hypothetical protein TorRG33x02_157510 [Trema orientale]
MGPVKLLLDKLRTISAWRFAIELGSSPSNLLLEMSMAVQRLETITKSISEDPLSTVTESW